MHLCPNYVLVTLCHKEDRISHIFFNLEEILWYDGIYCRILGQQSVFTGS